MVAGMPRSCQYLLTPGLVSAPQFKSRRQAVKSRPSATVRRPVGVHEAGVPPYGCYGRHLVGGALVASGSVAVGRGRDEGRWAAGSRAATCGALMKVPDHLPRCAGYAAEVLWPGLHLRASVCDGVYVSGGSAYVHHHQISGVRQLQRHDAAPGVGSMWPVVMQPICSIPARACARMRRV